MKPDEQALYDALVQRGDNPIPSVSVIAMSLDMPRSRLEYLLREKWSAGGLWAYDVHWSMGWLVIYAGLVQDELCN